VTAKELLSSMIEEVDDEMPIIVIYKNKEGKRFTAYTNVSLEELILSSMGLQHQVFRHMSKKIEEEQ
jgi:hypothetical protein